MTTTVDQPTTELDQDRPRCVKCGSTLIGPLTLNDGRVVMRCRSCGEVQ